VLPDPTPLSSPKPRRAPRWLGAGVGVLWLGLVALGFSRMWGYGAELGPPAEPPLEWPAACELELDPARPTLLMFAHPHCPCTRASVGELDRIAARTRERLRIVVLFVAPPGVGDEWTHSALWDSAAAIPGVEVRVDELGACARLFGARTSGQTLLYDSAGERVYAGGVTAARGHAGDNPGAAAVIAFARDGQAPRSNAPVFGCDLL
jgi:hypothetical protein